MQDFETALMVAARKGRVGIVKKLVRCGANVNLTNKVTWLVWWTHTNVVCLCIIMWSKWKAQAQELD